MGKLLERAIEELSKLPDTDQETVGAWILAEVEHARDWNEFLSRPSEILERAAIEALADYSKDKTARFDPEKL